VIDLGVGFLGTFPSFLGERLEKKGMENGHDGKLAQKLSGLSINQHSEQQVHDQSNLSSNNNDNLYQVMKAVEAAEATIKQQVLWFQRVLLYKIDSLGGACSLFSYEVLSLMCIAMRSNSQCFDYGLLSCVFCVYVP